MHVCVLKINITPFGISLLVDYNYTKINFEILRVTF